MSTQVLSDSSSVVRLDDGRDLHLRPMRADDTAALMAMHRQLSARTVYQRFFTAVPELPLQQAHRFTHVDGVTRIAVVAEDVEGRLVAVGRYDRLPPGGRRAEVAIVVRDDYQGQHLGTSLVRVLLNHARAHQVSELVADVLVTNTPMMRAFAAAGLRPTATYDAGVAHLVMPVPRSDAADASG